MFFFLSSHLEKSMDQSVVGISGYKLSVTVSNRSFWDHSL